MSKQKKPIRANSKEHIKARQQELNKRTAEMNKYRAISSNGSSQKPTIDKRNQRLIESGETFRSQYAAPRKKQWRFE